MAELELAWRTQLASLINILSPVRIAQSALGRR